MLDSSGKRVAEQGQLQFLSECRSDWISLTDAGREFHVRDAAAGNAWSPRVDRRVSGKTSVDVAADRRRRCEATSAIRLSISARYRGTVLCRQRCVRTHSRTGFSPVLLASVVHGEVELCFLTSSLRRQVERQRSSRTEDAAPVHQIHQSTLNNSSQRW